MTDYKPESSDESLNQSESDDAYWLENKIKEQLQQGPNDENSDAMESPVVSQHSYSQSEECYKGFGGFGNPFFNPPNFNPLLDNQPILPPGLGSVDHGFSRDPFAKDKADSSEHPLLLFSEPLNANELFKVPQNQMPKHSRFSHCEPEPVKTSLKSRLKLQSVQFKPDHDATLQGEHQNEEIEGNEGDQENVEFENLDNKIAPKEILGETPENKEKNETPEQVKDNPYEKPILSKREIEERRRKQAAEAEAEAAAKKPKTSEVVVVAHTKQTDEIPNHEHKNEKTESKNTLETPKHSQNKIPKSVTKQEPHYQHQQTKSYSHHHENDGITKQQSFKKEDSFKQATKHKKRASFQQEKEIVEYVEKKNLPPPVRPKEDAEVKPKLAGVNKFNKFELLVGSQSSASSESNDSLDENLEANEVKKGSNSPKKPESKSVIPEKDNDQQGSNKKKNKKKQKNKNKTLTSNKDLDSTPKEIKEIEEKVKTPSEEAPEEPSDEEAEKPQNKPSSKSAKNKKKKANKKKKKNATSIQALEDDKEMMKGIHLKENPDSDLSQISETEHETWSQNIKKKTLREICEDPRMLSSGFLFIPGSNFHDDLLKGMKLIPR